jgi:hypothetical protein
VDIAAGADLARLEPGIEQVEGLLIVRILRCHERRKDRHENHDDHNDQSRNSHGALTEVGPEVGEPGPARFRR